MVSQPERAESRAYRITGRVQGVGFRQWTQRTAESLGVSGTVRNLPDGSVEVKAYAGVDALTRFEAGLKRGPLAARVDVVETLAATPGEPESGFHVLR